MIEIDGHKYISQIKQTKFGPLEHYVCLNCNLTYFNSIYIDLKMKNLSCNEMIIKNTIE